MDSVISSTLEQILEVYVLVYKYKYQRLDAVKRVARKHRIDQQTTTARNIVEI